MNPNSTYDAIIVGGGMVGASLAAALHEHTGKRIAVIEAFAFESQAQPSFDDRVIALSYGSRRIFEAMKLWPQLQSQIEPILSIHVSDRGHFGASRLHHSEENVEALGYVAENRVIGQALMSRVQQCPHIDWLCPAQIESLQQDDAGVDAVVRLHNEHKKLRCKLLIAADGAASRTRELAGLALQRQEYGQSAIIANVQTEFTHNNMAYERFMDTGPLALLPMKNVPMTQNRCSVVWTVRSDDVAAIMALSDEDFVSQLQQRFGFRLGHIQRCGKRSVYPLAYVAAEQLTKGRVAIIGNAAHALHPVSGQGYNLALRDVAAMAELIARHEDPGHALLLADYHAKRYQDMQRVYRFTDSLVQIFSNRFSPLAHARAAGLIMLDMLPSLRHVLAKQSMGLLAPMSRMLRRLPP
jgi:2-octaprenyl-6-methoxyphenol hydroxylase